MDDLPTDPLHGALAHQLLAVQRRTVRDSSKSFASIICRAIVIAPSDARAKVSNSAVGNCCHDSSQARLASTEKLAVNLFADP